MTETTQAPEQVKVSSKQLKLVVADLLPKLKVAESELSTLQLRQKTVVSLIASSEESLKTLHPIAGTKPKMQDPEKPLRKPRRKPKTELQQWVADTELEIHEWSKDKEMLEKDLATKQAEFDSMQSEYNDAKQQLRDRDLAYQAQKNTLYFLSPMEWLKGLRSAGPREILGFIVACWIAWCIGGINHFTIDMGSSETTKFVIRILTLFYCFITAGNLYDKFSKGGVSIHTKIEHIVAFLLIPVAIQVIPTQNYWHATCTYRNYIKATAGPLCEYLKDHFSDFDTNHDGVLSDDELDAALALDPVALKATMDSLTPRVASSTESDMLACLKSHFTAMSTPIEWEDQTTSLDSTLVLGTRTSQATRTQVPSHYGITSIDLERYEKQRVLDLLNQ